MQAEGKTICCYTNYTVISHVYQGVMHIKKRRLYLFGDVEIEDHHAEVVDYEGLPECIGLAVLHVSRSRPQEEQVQAADDHSGEGR